MRDNICFCFFFFSSCNHNIYTLLVARLIKNTYFEKHLWTAASENQLPSDKFTEKNNFTLFHPFKSFSILNFVMMKLFCHKTCFAKVYLLLFSFSQTWYFWHTWKVGPRPGTPIGGTPRHGNWYPKMFRWDLGLGIPKGDPGPRTPKYTVMKNCERVPIYLAMI